MLAITRKRGEEIRLLFEGSEGAVECVVRVARLDGSRVRLALQAPASVRIVRGELPLAKPAGEMVIHSFTAAVACPEVGEAPAA